MGCEGNIRSRIGYQDAVTLAEMVHCPHVCHGIIHLLTSLANLVAGGVEAKQRRVLQKYLLTSILGEWFYMWIQPDMFCFLALCSSELSWSPLSVR